MDTLVVFGAGALLVRVGQTLYVLGLCRSKNAAASVMRSVCDLCVAILAFWAVGAAILLQQGNGFFGLRPSLLAGWDNAAPGLIFFYSAVILIATGAVGGTLAERSRFFPLLATSVLVAGFIVPVAGRWVWSGWLGRLGFVDAGGASAVHLVAGVCALVGAVVLGPRSGKYNRDGSTNMIPGHNVPLAAVGTLLMLAGWVPYTAGFDGSAALNVLLAAAAGGAGAMVLGQVRYGKPDIVLTLAGLTGGLVSSTACAGIASSRAAVLIGAVAGVLVPACIIALDLIGHVDDPTGAISIHGVGGAWGVIAAGLVGRGSFTEHLKSLGVQILGVAAIVALAAALSAALFVLLRSTVGFRSKEADEFDGLDLAEHDVGAYPDFQQTTIKSYHLREA